MELFKAQLVQAASDHAASLARAEQDVAASRAAVQAEQARREIFLNAYIDAAQATLDRMLKRAELLATAATTAAAIYGAVLGVSFSLQDGQPLTLLGLVPALLLGTSVISVAAYLSGTTRGTMKGRALAAGSGPRADQNRLNTYITWVNATALYRSWALTVSVIALALGVAAFPLPFLFPG